MSIAGILTSNLFDYSPQSTQNNFQQFQQDFQQLGQDLQAGNLSAAQTDFTNLQQTGPLANSTATTSPTQSTNPIMQEFGQLSQALQSGNITAAQQDYATIQQDMQTQAAQGHHGRHHHHGGGSSGSSGSDANSPSQLFAELGQALQSGNLTTAQQAYASLQQEFQAFGESGGAQGGTTGSTGSVSVVA